jgi:hypothetical protein
MKRLSAVTIPNCQKWGKCNAPICPLDPDYLERTFSSADAVCFYLSEAVKDAAQATFQRWGLGELFKVIAEAVTPISTRWTTIAARLGKARTSASRMKRIPAAYPRTSTTLQSK